MSDDTFLTFETTTARLHELWLLQHYIRDRCARLTALQVALAARELYPTAEWVGLANGDQDASGYQWITSVIGHDLELLGDSVDDAAEVDLNDINSHIWIGFTDPATSHEALHEVDPHAERFLRIDRVINEVRS